MTGSGVSTEQLVAQILASLELVSDRAERAEKVKNEGNTYFKNQKFEIASELYSKAIELEPSSAVLRANRSMAYLKSELYGSALEDADAAISLDPKYLKGYYRRASANMALGRFKKALKDFEAVTKACPTDVEAKKKHEECAKIWRRIQFERAIAVEEDAKSVAETIDIDAMAVEDSYDGPRLDGEISSKFMLDLVETFKKQGKLHQKYAYKILLAIRAFFMQQPTLVDVPVADGQKFTICGDVHGQFYDLVNIFELNGHPSEDNPYLFNGDFVDRGSFSVETIFTLFGYKLLYPKSFYMSRGNHESDVMNRMYGFEGEVKAKFSSKMADLFTEIFNYLPLAHVVAEKIFVCHGGLFREDGITLDAIRKTHRVRQPPDEGIMCDLLWSDPFPLPGRTPSKRGVGCQFGPDVTERFCKENGIDYVVRSHEVKPDGWEEHHDGKCYTVFSAPNYCDQMGNQGAFITIKGGTSLKPRFTSFDAVPHPQVRPMAYSSLGNMMGF